MLHLGNRLQNGLLQPKIQLTERQAQLLIFIWRYFLEHQRYPSHREITAALGSTSSNAGPWIDGLARKGVIAKVDGRRNIRITDQGVTTLIDLGVVRQEQLEL
jgi:DNA-binding MarR family transcriptional regulator